MPISSPKTVAMSIPHDHHFIPAFYLSQWAVIGDELIEYCIKRHMLIAKPVGPRATGYVRDLYAFPELPPEHAQHLEAKFFNYADNVAAQALAMHLSGQRDAAIWTSELVSGWSRFVMGVHLRHPDVLPELKAGAGTVWDKSGDTYQKHYEQVRTADHPPTMDEWIATVDPVTRAKVQLNAVMKMIDNEEVGACLNKMRHAVVDLSGSPFQLLTSDRPVQLYRINQPDGFVAMPISPTKLFVGAHRPTTFERLRAAKPKALVQDFNKFIVSRARKFVWASDRSQTYFIEKYMSKALEPTPFFPTLGNYPGADTAAA